MANVVDKMVHDGRVWILKTDTLGRPYAVAEGLGRIPVDTYKTAKGHDPLSDYE